MSETTLIVQILSFNIAADAPVLFILGLVAFCSGPRSRIKDIGRLSIGLGLMLLALHILLDTLAPAENALGVRVSMNAITGDPVLCIVIGAAVTWVLHSSVASVTLVMSLAYAQFMSPPAALALVLGANLVSAINPLLEGARRDNPASYRLPLGNLSSTGWPACCWLRRSCARSLTHCRGGGPTRRYSRLNFTSRLMSRPRSSSSAYSMAWRCSSFRIACRKPIRHSRAISTRAR